MMASMTDQKRNTATSENTFLNIGLLYNLQLQQLYSSMIFRGNLLFVSVLSAFSL